MARHAELIDEDRLEEWPELFTQECVYKIIARENVDRGDLLRQPQDAGVNRQFKLQSALNAECCQPTDYAAADETSHAP